MDIFLIPWKYFILSHVHGSGVLSCEESFMEFYHPDLCVIRSPKLPDVTLPGVLSFKQKELPFQVP